MDLPLHVTGPLTQHPDSTWLADRPALPYAALRAFAEACWAWAAFQSQQHLPARAVRWGRHITNKADLFDFALAQRQAALKTGFFRLTSEHLEDLLVLPCATTDQALIRDRFVALADRHAETQDRYGQPLPAPLLEILRAIEAAPPYGRQGNSALTKRVTIRRQAYFAKMTDEELSGMPPLGQDELHEVSAHAAIRALCPTIAATAAYHIVAADGQQCSLVTAVPGRYYAERRMREVAALVEVRWLQWIALAEWLCGTADRHYRNLNIQRETRRAGMLDLARAWRYDVPDFLGWDEEIEPPQCESFARALWECHDADLVFARALLVEAVAQEGAMVAAIAPFPLGDAARGGLAQRFAIIRAALAQELGDIRLHDLEKIARIW